MSSVPQRRKGEGVKPLELGGKQAPLRVAKVRRNFCGTGPFDRHWLNLDCCGIFCAGLTYALHFYGIYAVTMILIPPWMSYKEESVRYLSMAGVLHRLVFTTIAFLAITSHFKAMTTDPGTVPPDAKPLEEPPPERETRSLLDPPVKGPGRRLCRRCKTFKPQRAHHCSVCNRCVIKLDHHCPWVNNCVGIGNHKYFLLFVFYTFLSCVYSLSLVVFRFSTCGMGRRDGINESHSMHHHHRHKTFTCMDKPTDLIFVLGLLIEAILFGMFTSCMMFDQYDVVRSKVTHIDRLQNAEIGGSLSGFTEVFGVGKRGAENASFRWDWLSPFARVCFPTVVTNEMMGFCRPCRKQPEDTSLKEKNTLSIAEIV